MTKTDPEEKKLSIKANPVLASTETTGSIYWKAFLTLILVLTFAGAVFIIWTVADPLKEEGDSRETYALAIGCTIGVILIATQWVCAYKTMPLSGRQDLMPIQVNGEEAAKVFTGKANLPDQT